MFKLIRILVVCVGVIVLFNGVSLAKAHDDMPVYGPETQVYQICIKVIQGHWVNNNGDVLDFKGNYLNGCRIIRIERCAGGGAHYSGLFVIEEKDGVRGLDIYCQCAKHPYDETYMDGGNGPVLRYNNSYYHRR